MKLSDFVPYALYDIRYMTTNNFMGTVLYPSSYIPTVRKDMALRLAAVATDLFQKGYRLSFWGSTSIKAIPCLISSSTTRNNFQPVLLD